MKNLSMICSRKQSNAGNDMMKDKAQIKQLLKELLADEYGIKPLKLPEIKAHAKSELAGVEVAYDNYIENGKEYFTYEEALEVEQRLAPTGWRLPTRQEWVLICEEFATDKNGSLDSQRLISKTHLQKHGVFDDNGMKMVTGNGYSGSYWSSTKNLETSYVYSLYFDKEEVKINYSSLPYNKKYCIRLVRDVEK